MLVCGGGAILGWWQFAFAVIFLSTATCLQIPIGLIIESSRTTEISAVSYAVEFANTHILASDTIDLKIGTFNENSTLNSMHVACDVMTEGIVALIGPATTRHVNTISPILNAQQIPLVLPIGLNTPRWQRTSPGFTLHLRPPDEFRGKVVASILKRMLWKRVHILSRLAGQRLLLDSASTNDWIVVSSQSFEFGMPHNISLQLDAIRISGYRVTILNCMYEQAKIILDEAKARHMTGVGWLWILTGDEFVDPATMSLTPPVPNHMQGLITIGTQSVTNDIGIQFPADWTNLNPDVYPGSGTTLPITVGRWVDAVFAVAYAVRDYGGHFATPVGLTCTGSAQYSLGRTLLEEWEKSSGWKKVATFNTLMQYQPIGSERILLPGNLSAASDTVSVINGRHLRAVTLVVEPFNFYVNGNGPTDPMNVNPDKDQFVGMVLDIFKELSTILNFTYSIYMVPDGKYGGKNKVTGKWNGMVGEVLAGRADIISSMITMSRQRLEVIDFTRAWNDNGYNIALSKFEKVVGSWEFMKVFGFGIWTYMGTTILLVGLVVTLCESLSPYGFYGRVATIGWWSCIVPIISMYTAGLGSLLISARMQTEINSLEDLVAQDRVQYGAISGANTVNIICNGEQPVFKTMCKFMRKQGTIIPSTQAYARTMDPNDPFAMVHSSLVVDALIEKQPCKLRKLPQIFSKKGFAFGMPKGSPYNDILSQTIQQLRDNGYMDSQLDKWFKQRSECAASNRVLTYLENNQQRFNDLKGVWIIMIAAITMSPILIVIEYIGYCIQKVKKFNSEGVGIGFCTAASMVLSRAVTDLIVNLVPECFKSEGSFYREKHGRKIKWQSVTDQPRWRWVDRNTVPQKAAGPPNTMYQNYVNG